MSYLQALAVFIAVAEEKSFSAAAKKLSLTQPTVSFHIDSIERKFGCPLFTRTRRGAELTVYGRTLYENTRNVQELLDRTERKIKDLCRGVAGQVTIGAGTIPGEYILPPLLAVFLQEHPGVSVNLISGDSQSIFQSWQEGRVSICVLGFLPPGISDVQIVWTDEIIPVSLPQMHLAGLPWSPQELCRCPMIVRHESSSSMGTVWRSLHELGVSRESCNIVLQVSGNEALKKAVQAGVGIGFVSRRVVERELAEGSLVQVPIQGLQIKRHFYALCDTQALMPVGLALWQYLVSQREQLQSQL